MLLLRQPIVEKVLNKAVRFFWWFHRLIDLLIYFTDLLIDLSSSGTFYILYYMKQPYRYY